MGIAGLAVCVHRTAWLDRANYIIAIAPTLSIMFNTFIIRLS